MITDTTVRLDAGPELQRRDKRARRRRLIVTAIVAVVAAVAATTVLATGVNPFHTSHPASRTNGADDSEGTSLATVTRQDLSSQTQLGATLGYAGSYTVVYQSASSGSSGSSGSPTGGGASGGGGSSQTFTALPSVGAVVSEGQVLYRVNNDPVILLYGTTPAYRTLSESRYASDVTGPDVAELNADLVALGYATHAQIPAGSDEFSSETKDALEKLQHHLGLDETGTLALGQAVFLPSAARVTSVSASVGGTAQAGSTVFAATTTDRQVSVALNTSQQGYVKVGDKVTITLPNNRTTPGVVSSVGTVASSSSGSGSGSSSSSGNNSSSSNPTITVLITPSDPAATGTWDQAPVSVTITTATVSNALVVPITALLSRPGGGYAVEVADPNGTHRLVEVTLGVFDDADGLVQVTGSGLAAGQHVVVPTL